MQGYLERQDKSICFGCEACVQICPKIALTMVEDEEGFRYPKLNPTLCIHCGLCRKVCPYETMPPKSQEFPTAFGGNIKDPLIRAKSTSGGAFSAIAETWCDENYAIFGAVADRLNVYHSFIRDKKELSKFRKSKYSQSKIGSVYLDTKIFLDAGTKVLFSGTPCQIAGLKAFLQGKNYPRLLTVEVICEGVPSPLFMRKYNASMIERHGSPIEQLDYRYKDFRELGNRISVKWDFQVQYVQLENKKEFKRDRWLNPFWSIWLQHLMSRPSCYKCPFTTQERIADITLGDLWGVHLYCPELYGNNSGASLVVCNTKLGKYAFDAAKAQMNGHELQFEEALKYQSPLRKSIAENVQRSEFMNDLTDPDTTYGFLCKKWGKRPSLNLLWSKYVWGNRQKVFVWNWKQKWRNLQHKPFDRNSE